MAWYDFFAGFYDASLEKLYADARQRAAGALALGEASRVLDLPTGTGQSLDPLVERLSEDGVVLGVDLSPGMLTRAKKRAEGKGFADRVRLRQGDVHELDGDLLEEALGVRTVDRLHVFLGLTAFPRHVEAFENLWSLLEPGGRAVVVDVHAETLGFQGRMVNLVARADIRRRAWEPLERLAEDYTRTDLPADLRFGGNLWLASGRKPV